MKECGHTVYLDRIVLPLCGGGGPPGVGGGPPFPAARTRRRTHASRVVVSPRVTLDAGSSYAFHKPFPSMVCGCVVCAPVRH